MYLEDAYKFARDPSPLLFVIDCSLLLFDQYCYTVDPVTNDLASARQKKSMVTESRWSQE